MPQSDPSLSAIKELHYAGQTHNNTKQFEHLYLHKNARKSSNKPKISPSAHNKPIFEGFTCHHHVASSQKSNSLVSSYSQKSVIVDGRKIFLPSFNWHCTCEIADIGEKYEGSDDFC